MSIRFHILISALAILNKFPSCTLVSRRYQVSGDLIAVPSCIGVRFRSLFDGMNILGDVT